MDLHAWHSCINEHKQCNINWFVHDCLEDEFFKLGKMLELVSYFTEFVLGRCCDATSEALPGVLGNREKGHSITGEQGNKDQIMRGTGNKDNIGERGTLEIFLGGIGEQGNR